MLLNVARIFTAAGCCVIPIRPDGSKAPAARWVPYQLNLPPDEQLKEWFDAPPGSRSRYDGLGVVCGAVSGGLELFELEGRAVHLGPRLGQLLADNGGGDLWTRLCNGYLEQSPSGGYHWLYRIDPATGAARRNTKLARRPATAAELAENPQDKIKVLLETRGEGGFVVVAPSAGRTHETGRSWILLAGGPATIPTITAEERDLLYAAASMLDQMPAADPVPAAAARHSQTEIQQGRPGDDFNQRASWDDILTPHGWQRTRKTFAGNGAAWTRPGKQHGVSATTGTSTDGVDRLYVFSTSTVFETERPYSKFAAYAHLEHGGDLSKAAAQLRADGYGAPLEPPRDTGPALGWIGPAGSAGASAPAARPATYTLTDDGNALRLVDQHRGTIRYCPQRGQWLRWADHRWVWDEAETIRELARGIARDLPGNTQTTAAHRKRSLQAAAVGAMCRLAQTDPRIVVHLGELDAHPYELNTPGGVVDLPTGQIRSPDPTALHTRSTTVAPDPDQHAPLWLRFLADTFAGDPEMTIYVQRLLGVSLIGDVLEQILPFAYGAGANGKTTLLGAVQRILGIGDTGYAISAPADMLLASATQGHPTDVARLSGARLVITSELEDGQRFAEARVKQLTGRDVLTGRFMRQDFFSFVPTHTLWLLANHQPAVRAGGPAFWRRIALLPFLHTVPTQQRDPHLEDRLVDHEGPAILAWLVTGARDYLNHGLATPDAVKAATAAYERDQDTVARFVDEMCEIGPPTAQHLHTRVSAVRAEYESWCHAEGERPVSPKALTQTLRSRYGIYSERSSQARWYAGIRITDIPQEPPQQASPQLSLPMAQPSPEPPPDSSSAPSADDRPAPMTDQVTDDDGTPWWQR